MIWPDIIFCIVFGLMCAVAGFLFGRLYETEKKDKAFGNLINAGLRKIEDNYRRERIAEYVDNKKLSKLPFVYVEDGKYGDDDV